MGVPPLHPELLDWLATEFVQKGWSMKAMHRLIMNSETYKMASTFSREADLKAIPPTYSMEIPGPPRGSRDHSRPDTFRQRPV